MYRHSFADQNGMGERTMSLRHWLQNLIDLVKSGPPRRLDRQARRSVPRQRLAMTLPKNTAARKTEDRCPPRAARRRQRQAGRRFVLALQALEDRVLPSVTLGDFVPV